MIIRRANINDAKRISYLIRQNTLRVNENGYTKAKREAWSNQNKPKSIKEQLKRREFYCAIEHGKLVGTVALENNLVCGMYVSSSKRGKGLGQKLLSHIENVARQKNLKELILTATPSGYGFYKKNGYKTYGKTVHKYEGQKFPEPKMRKKLQ